MKQKYIWLNHIFNFLAVILGVYLAFYINEKALLNQDRNESVILMKSLVNDLSEDIMGYEQNTIPLNNHYQQNIENLLDVLLKNDLEGIEGQLQNIFQIENRFPSTSTFSSMKTSGKFRLIEDLTLQKNLTDFYEGLVIESAKKGDYQVDYFTNELLTWLTNNVDILEMKLLNKEELIIFRNRVIIYNSLLDQKVNSYEMIVEESKNLKLQIEAILDSK